MRTEVLAWCRREALFEAGNRVVCAVSGGADSMAMLWCLHSLQDELGITVSAAHFNHRLRGAEADADEAFVRTFCKAQGIPLSVGSAEVAAYAAEHKLSTETAAREARYAFLETLPCERIATAHNAEDNAETVLLHLLRGSGLRGLCGIPPRRGRVVRPLLSVTRAQVEDYLRENGLSWVQDATNAGDECLRNRIRHRLLPLFKQENPSFVPLMTRQSALLRSEDALLDSDAAALLERARAVQGGWYCAPLSAAPEALQKRALRLLLRRYLPADAAAVHIAQLQRLLTAESPSARCALPHRLTAQRQYDCFVISGEVPLPFAQTPLQIPGTTVLPSLGLRILCKKTKIYKKNKITPFHFAVKCDMIAQSILFVRPRRVGDQMSVSGGHNTTLKKLLIDRKIPRAQRERIPVITDGQNILAVPGIGINRRFAPQEGEPALLILVEKEEM